MSSCFRFLILTIYLSSTFIEGFYFPNSFRFPSSNPTTSPPPQEESNSDGRNCNFEDFRERFDDIDEHIDTTASSTNEQLDGLRRRLTTQENLISRQSNRLDRQSSQLRNQEVQLELQSQQLSEQSVNLQILTNHIQGLNGMIVEILENIRRPCETHSTSTPHRSTTTTSTPPYTTIYPSSPPSVLPFEITEETESFINLLNVINSTSLRNLTEVTNKIDDFYFYLYDGAYDSYYGGVYDIMDGRNDMFDSGNKIKFGANGRNFTTNSAIYDSSYSRDGVAWATFASHPFLALMWANKTSFHNHFRIYVEGNAGADGRGKYEKWSSSFSIGMFDVEYHVAQIYDAYPRDPSICEVYFTVTSQVWNTTSTYSYLSSLNDTDRIRAFYDVAGNHFLMGYTLLSRSQGKFVTGNQVQSSLTVLLQQLLTSFASGNSSLTENVEGCESNKVKTECGSLCEPTCVNRAPICPEGCVSKCSCPTATIWSDFHQLCVPQHRCPSNETFSSTPSPYTSYTSYNSTPWNTRLPFEISEETESFINLLNVINSTSARNITEVTNKIDDFYFYRYDGYPYYGGVYDIGDGGNDMFDSGNKIKFGANGINFTTNPTIYDSSYARDGVAWATFASHPFLALMWVNKTDQYHNYLTIYVEGNAGADRGGKYEKWNSSFSIGMFDVEYDVAQIYDAYNDPSICEVYFTVTSQIWNTTATNSTLSNISNTDHIDKSYNVTGNHFFMGYTLLSRSQGKFVTGNQVQSSLTVLVHELVLSFVNGNTSLTENVEGCESNKVKTECGSLCEPTCVDRTPICPEVCVSKCSCPTATIWSDFHQLCIPHYRCPSDETSTTTPGYYTTEGEVFTFY